MNLYSYCGNNSLNLVDPSGLTPITDSDLDILLTIGENYARLAREGIITDVEAIAQLADWVVIFTGSEPSDVPDFVDAYTKVASAWLWDGFTFNIVGDIGDWGAFRNPNYPYSDFWRFADDGFKEEYKENLSDNPDFRVDLPGWRDQSTHFIGFLGAGYHASPFEWAANWFLERHESSDDTSPDAPDMLLGTIAIQVGGALKTYEMHKMFGVSILYPCPLCEASHCNGLAPNQVGDWIRNNLAEPEICPRHGIPESECPCP